MDILWLIIGGVVIGLLGKFVAPGDKDNIPLWLTVLCGIGGIILGYYIYAPSAATARAVSTGSAGSSPSSPRPSWS